MSVNPYEPPNNPGSVSHPRLAPPGNLLEALWRGAKAGWKWTTYIVGPFALLMLIGALVLLALGYSLGRLRPTWDDVLFLGNCFGFYLSSCLWGIVIGILIAGLRYGLGWRRPQAERASD